MNLFCGNVSRHAGTAPADFTAGEKEGNMKEFICDFCKKVISGEYIEIRTKRGTDLHICKECMEKERNGKKQERA